jgi:hypothetical protein
MESLRRRPGRHVVVELRRRSSHGVESRGRLLGTGLRTGILTSSLLLLLKILCLGRGHLLRARHGALSCVVSSIDRSWTSRRRRFDVARWWRPWGRRSLHARHS